jgi:hypothetical protein
LHRHLKGAPFLPGASFWKAMKSNLLHGKPSFRIAHKRIPYEAGTEILSHQD